MFRDGRYTMRVILPRLRDHWNKLGYPNLSVALAACRDQLEQTDQKLMECYLEEKVTFLRHSRFTKAKKDDICLANLVVSISAIDSLNV